MPPIHAHTRLAGADWWRRAPETAVQPAWSAARGHSQSDEPEWHAGLDLRCAKPAPERGPAGRYRRSPALRRGCAWPGHGRRNIPEAELSEKRPGRWSRRPLALLTEATAACLPWAQPEKAGNCSGKWRLHIKFSGKT